MDFNTIKKMYDELCAERDKYTATWNNICKYAGIKSTLRKNTALAMAETPSDDNFDKYTYDPTAALAIQQSADYLKGIMWGNGDNVFSLEPSEEVLAQVDIDVIKDWYENATNIVLSQMNHNESGLNNALSAYFYDQKCLGTSGIGAFQSRTFKNGVSNSAITFKPYTVDTMCIDEGRNGNVDIVFNTYNWRVNRIISEFCFDSDGNLNNEQFSKMPEKVKNAYKNNKINESFKIVHAILPNELYDPTKYGKNGCKYSGYWFSPEEQRFFLEENYNEKPVAVCREEKIRGEIYGRSAGTMMLSTIKCTNEAVISAMVSMDKMNEPPIGIVGSALFGDNKVDLSAGGLTVFNESVLRGANPVVAMQDIIDPTPLINMLLPYLNEKIATAFKVDLLLDFAAKSNMTATEAMQRYAIRGRALAGMINKHKTEMFIPLIERCIAILWDIGLLGVNPLDPVLTQKARELKQEHRIIPQEVWATKEQGLKWFKIKFNNDIEKLTRVEIFEDLQKEMGAIGLLLQMNQQLSSAIDWYKLTKKTADSIGFPDIIVSEQSFKEQQEAQAAQMQQMQELQAQNVQSQTNRNNAGALKDTGDIGAMDNGFGF